MSARSPKINSTAQATQNEKSYEEDSILHETLSKRELYSEMRSPVDIVVEDMETMSVHMVNAIPKKVTDMKYKLAVGRGLHAKSQKKHQTRRDMTLERIQENVY